MALPSTWYFHVHIWTFYMLSWGAVYNPQKVTSGGAACSRAQGMCSELMPTVCRVWGQHTSRRLFYYSAVSSSP